MPDVTLTELVLGAVAALSSGGAGVAIARRPRPGTPEDHEQRLTELERAAREHHARMGALEHRMSSTETAMAANYARLTESGDNIQHSLESLARKVDKIHDTLVRVDVETTVERELRRNTQHHKEPPR